MVPLKPEFKKTIFSNTKSSVKNETSNPLTGVEQLKDLNFEIANEIRNIDFLIEYKNKIKLNIKNISLSKEKDTVFLKYKNNKK